jgi:hypothetical protein
MRDAKEFFGRIAQTNHYQVYFSTLSDTITSHVRSKFGVSDVKNFVSRKTGILCSDASLPASGFATAEVKGDFMGVPQEFAHTRLYTDVDFTFYVDSDYNNLRIFEGWMDYISGASGMNENSDVYYRRFQYPTTYKVDTMYITKFERDYKRELVYQFKNVFPKSMTAIPVSYGVADLLKVNVTFNYDRYIVNPRNYGARGAASSTNKTPLSAGEEFRTDVDIFLPDKPILTGESKIPFT